MKDIIQKRVFTIDSEKSFTETALAVFRYQYENNSIYREFTDLLGNDYREVDSLNKIPFIPIEFFKSHRIVTGTDAEKKVFESSGTTEIGVKSRHYVTDILLYEESFIRGFRYFYGDPADYLFFALLPSYVERSGSSLVYMVETLTGMSNDPISRIDRTDIPEVIKDIYKAKRKGEKILFIGVSFALLDCAEKYSPDLSGVIVMETGGMKGVRKEMTREELHSMLKTGLNVPTIHSEYGMTELLSQAYSSGNGLFRCPPWMKVVIRDPLDPMTIFEGYGKSGGINIIDLANLNSCSFISTGDLGKITPDGSFEVLGRFDRSDIRGCNLLTL
jgi:phenylacetate-coenzyme A ligase PaaK-like adenylate-forming protein